MHFKRAVDMFTYAVVIVIAVSSGVLCHQNNAGQQTFGTNQAQPHGHGQAPQQQQFQQPGQQAPYRGQQQQQQQQQGVFDRTQVQDREHIKEHLEGVAQADTSKMTDQELQFHYFKMHDSDNNNKLDGSELIKSLIHWHDEEKPEDGNEEMRIFKDEELANMIDPILESDDKNYDGCIDYAEYSEMLKSPTY